VDGLDTDLPTAAEAFVLDSVLGKAFFCTFQIVFYALRPMLVYRIPVTALHVFNIAAQLAFDALVVRFAGGRALAYLILSSFLAGSLHPCAGHFIAEHYVLDRTAVAARTPSSSSSASTSAATSAAGTNNATPSALSAPSVPAASNTSNADDKASTTAAVVGGATTTITDVRRIPVPETFSYYGPLNALTYNVGLHNEHHDFPAVPWTRLPQLHRIAAEFYRDLPCHASWPAVLWQFVWDPAVGLHCRVKRQQKRNPGPLP
jgi:sphingolipid delta-4 desaturase